MIKAAALYVWKVIAVSAAHIARFVLSRWSFVLDCLLCTLSIAVTIVLHLGVIQHPMATILCSPYSGGTGQPCV